MSNVHQLRRTRNYNGKIIPSSTRTVIENCGHEGDEPHVHLIGFSGHGENTAEYEMVLGEAIVRHIVAVFREQGCKL